MMKRARIAGAIAAIGAAAVITTGMAVANAEADGGGTPAAAYEKTSPNPSDASPSGPVQIVKQPGGSVEILKLDPSQIPSDVTLEPTHK